MGNRAYRSGITARSESSRMLRLREPTCGPNIPPCPRILFEGLVALRGAANRRGLLRPNIYAPTLNLLALPATQKSIRSGRRNHKRQSFRLLDFCEILRSKAAVITSKN